MTSDRWLVCPRPSPDAAWQLFCFPHAGGGTGTFTAWAGGLWPGIELTAVCPPGRERHLAAAPHRDLVSLVAALDCVLSPRLRPPYAFFGHSLGALLAFELARVLARRGTGPAHLFLSASRPPHLLRREPELHQLDDASLLAVLSRHGGIPEDLASMPGMVELVLPPLRADLEILAGYRSQPGDPLACAMTAMGGDQDSDVLPASLLEWRSLTTGAFSRRLLPGGHFYLASQRHLVLDAIQRDLAAHDVVPSTPTPMEAAKP